MGKDAEDVQGDREGSVLTSNGKSEILSEENKTGKTVIGKEIIRDLLIAAVIAFGVSMFVRPTIVYETSMQPTIDPHDYLLMSKQAYRSKEVERGDVVIFKSDIELENTGKKKLLIKRVIGVPGDVITIADGNLYINGSKMEEKYIAKGGTPGKVYNVKVPKGEVFVMGDHREVSRDSREFGCVKQNKIVGKAIVRLFPFNKIEKL